MRKTQNRPQTPSPRFVRLLIAALLATAISLLPAADVRAASQSTDQDFYAEILDLKYYELADREEPALDGTGYAFLDLNADGKNELIIGNMAQDDPLKDLILLVAAPHNNVPYGVMESTDKIRYYLTPDLKITFEDQETSWHNIAGLYRFASDGLGTDLVESVESFKDDTGDILWKRTDSSGKETTITAKQAREIKDRYAAMRTTPEITPFSQYKPKNSVTYYDGMACYTFGAGYKTWKEGYLAYLEEYKDYFDKEYSFALINIDNDGTPELVIDTGFEAGGCQILSYYKGTVTMLQNNRRNFDYIEKSGLVCNSDGTMGEYCDLVYSLKKGKFRMILEGRYHSDFATDSITTTYQIDGRELSEDDYRKELGKVYDIDKAKAPDNYLVIDDLRSYLERGKELSAGHRYELFVEDCTWEEAQAKCMEKGGYLAALTCDAEFEKVDKLIKKQGHRDICFYIGAWKQSGQGWQWTEPGLTNPSFVSNVYGKHWFDRGPSNTAPLPDGTEITEDCAQYIYRKDDGKFYINDVPRDIIGTFPTYQGKIGYVCEYPE